MKELNYKVIGERLKKLRNYLGLTLNEVALMLDMSIEEILNIEEGTCKIDLQELINFSKLYSISIEELTSEECSISSDEFAFVKKRFNELSEKDKKEVISLFEYKDILKKQNSSAI